MNEIHGLGDEALPAPRRWRRRLKRRLLALASLLGGSREPLLRFYHRPDLISRRDGDFLCNWPGRLHPAVESAAYRLNDGPWRPVAQEPPRAHPPDFLIELAPDELRHGENRLEAVARAFARGQETAAVTFVYDPAPVAPPLRRDWTDEASAQGNFEVEDGYWQRFAGQDGRWRVRPAPGHEGYDRVLIVAGAFPGGRRVETDVVFRRHTGGKEWGFGLLPLWGGRPDEPQRRPRRGWLFALGWYFNRYRGVGLEFSERVGREPDRSIALYRSLQLQAGRPYRVIAECRPLRDPAGGHLAYRQRLKWWPADQAEPPAWLELDDVEGAALPVRDYGVALVCYGVQADFGPVAVLPLPALEVRPDRAPAPPVP